MNTHCEVIPYGGWDHCVRLTNGRTELVVTTDVGPRIIRYGKPGGQNFLKEYPKQLGRRGGSTWRIYGGHRLWIAPEDIKRTYVPDNEPVAWSWKGNVLSLQQPPDKLTRLAKEIRISFNPDGAVHLDHRITNHGRKAAHFAPWTLSVMAPGGEAVFPHEPYRSHLKEKLPSRPLVLWPYTDMSDPRWTWGKSEFRLRQDPTRPAPQKIGFLSTRGWMAYVLGNQVFVKRHTNIPGATYPDFGCNVETFTNDAMLELETLGPLVNLAKGQSTRHTETWALLPLAKLGALRNSRSG
jgi:hypothetical protein